MRQLMNSPAIQSLHIALKCPSLEVPRRLLTKRNITRFAEAARARLRVYSASLRKSYTRQLVSRIEIGDRQSRISGPHSGLPEGVLDCGGAPPAGVLNFVQG
jgi:hypothetical protein